MRRDALCSSAPSRLRRDRFRLLLRTAAPVRAAQLVTESADRADHIAAELAAQVVHVGVDDTGLLGVGEDRGEQSRSADHLPRVTGEHLEYLAFAFGQSHR